MREPIEVNYEPDGEDWHVTVTGKGQSLRGKAPGLIAARDRADQLVAKVVPDDAQRTVVHLLNGDALAFTSAYLSARLAKPTELPDEKPADGKPKLPSPAPHPDQTQRTPTS